MKKQKCNNSLQKGSRRQRLHDAQDNVGNSENPPEYENFNGKPVK